MGRAILFWIFLVLAALLTLVIILPVGIRIRYGQEGLKLWYAIGPVRLLHRPKDKEKQQKDKNDKLTLRTVLGNPNKADQKDDSALGNFWAELKIILDLFGYLRPKLRIKCFVLKLHLAGITPATMAIEYGCAWAAIGGLLPILEESFILKKRELDVDCDFSGEKTTLDAKLDISIGLGRLLWCLARYSLSTLKTTETKHSERR